MPALEDLIAELRRESTGSEAGRFTLDPERAREKLQRFQLADPRRYVLWLVQAAVSKGATRIAFDIDADDVRMQCDGDPFAPAQLENLFGALFGLGEGPGADAWRQLALGLNAALALNPRHITVCSGAALLTLRPDAPQELSAAPEPVPGFRVHVRDRFRPGVVVQFVRDLQGTLAEEQYLRSACAWSQVEITLDGKRISGREPPDDLVGPVSLEAYGLRGWLGLRPHQPGALVLLEHQVELATLPPPALLPGTYAVVDAPQVHTDLSQAQVIQDATFQQLIATLRAAEHRAVARLSELFASGDPSAHDGPTRWILLSALLRCPSLEVLARDEVYRQLAALPLWTDARGQRQPVCLRQVVEHFDATTTAYFSTERQPQLAPQGDKPVPYFTSKQENELFARLFGGGALNVTRRLRTEATAGGNRETWTRRPLQPALPERAYLARANLTGDGIRGEVGVRDLTAGWSRFFLILEGHLLAQVHYPFPMSGLEVFVQASFTPTRRFDGARRDGTLASVLLRTGEVLVELAESLAEAAGASPRPPAPALARAIIEGWSYTLDPRGPQRLLSTAGFDVDEYRKVLAGHVAQRRARTLGAAWKVPLFPALDGRWLALGELPAQVCVVMQEAGAPRPAPAVAADLGVDPSTVLLLEASARRLLTLLLGQSRLRDITAEITRRDLLARHHLRPVEMVELTGDVLLAVELSEVTGKIGVLAVGNAPTLRVRVLVQGRLYRHVEVPHPLGPLEAVVDLAEHPAETSGPLAPELSAGLFAGAQQVLQQVLSAYPTLTGPQRRDARRWLLSLLPRLQGPGAELVDWAPLRHAPLFRTAGHNMVTLATLQAMVERGERVPFVRMPQGDVLLLDADQEAALRQALGENALQLQTAVEREVSTSQTAPRLAGEMLVRASWEHGERRGEIGLPAAHDTKQRKVTLHFHTAQVLELTRSAACSWEASCPAPWPADARTLADELLPVLEHRVPALLSAMQKAWGSLRGEARDAAWNHVLDVLAAPGDLPAELLAPWEDMPQLRCVSGRPVTLRELRAFAAAHQHLPLAQASTSTTLPPGRSLLLRVSSHEHQRLPEIVGAPWEDLTAVLEGYRQLRERIRSRLPLPQPPRGAPAKLAIDDLKAGLRGQLWLPAAGERDGIALGIDGHVLCAVPAGLPCAGALEGPGVIPSPSGDSVQWSADQERWLHRQVIALYQGAVAHGTARLAGLGDEPLRLALLRALEVLDARLRDTRHLPREEMALYQHLSQLPLLRRNGQPTTLRQEKAANPTPAAGTDLLAGALHAALEPAVRRHGSQLTTLGAVRVVAGDERVATVTNAGIRLHQDHPVVQRALASPADGGLVLILASAVYSAFNQYASSVGNEDEAGFIDELVSAALAAQAERIQA